MTTRKATPPALAAVVLGTTLVLGACGSSGSSQSSSTTLPSATSPASPTTPADPAYHPTIVPSAFTSHVTNPYFPLRPNTTDVYQGTRDGQPQRDEVVISSEIRTIMGVRCQVVRDTVTSNGALVEKTTDWYAQSSTGDVWYFGEATAEYVNGQISSTHGTWEAGVDSAQPGIIMKAHPKPGDSYRQEYRPGQAEDTAKVLQTTATVKVPVGTFHNVVVTNDTDPLNPDKSDHKSYASGVGMIHSERVRSGHHEVIDLVRYG
ncbi:hypothetical protein C8250_039035 [Streptomyces sp. So13.3]|uniref:hypothetical protein n=1 Tax=Streptomyces TaxID=1883 RepID=UPI001105EA90|nr:MULTISPECIES: hypothetical protein [Streptomyces]MCZ4102960.1 hypothetical protein [Streptomyces sp. H39-C1]QNA77061.1 hypothetical protein C8250_039035 [Streptomyces sp. So13.3]